MPKLSVSAAIKTQDRASEDVEISFLEVFVVVSTSHDNFYSLR